MKRCIYILLTLCILSLEAGVSAFALEPDQKHVLDSILQQFQVEEVTVTAPAVEQEVIRPQTLKGEELERSGGLSVADALRYFSGVQLKDYGGVGGIKTINVRSMGSQHVGVFYNGIQLGNAQNGQIDLGKFALTEMEEIRLYNGQKSDIFQSAREMGSAGAVYLQSRKPYFRPGEKVHARISMRCGSFALVNPSASLDIKLSERLALTLNGEYVYADGKYKFRYLRFTPDGSVAYDTTAVRENGDVHAFRAEMGVHHYYSTTGFWRIQAYYYQSERGVPGAIVNNVWSNGERLWDRNAFVQTQWQEQVGRVWYIKFNLKYANDYTHYINQDMRLLPADNSYLQQELYASLAQKFHVFDWWQLSLAYDFQYNKLRRDELMEPVLTEHFDRFSHWLSLATAFKVRDMFRIQASALMTAIEEQVRFTPAVFFNYRPFHRHEFYINAFYKQSYRYPTFNDLYYTDLGNADLKPELARQRNIGLEYSLPFALSSKFVPAQERTSLFSINADFYYNRISDKIIAYPKGQQFRWTMLNLGLVRIFGLDLATSVRLALPLRWNITGKLQYTWQNAKDVTNPSDTYYGHQIPYIPHHSGTAVLELDWASRRGDVYGLNYSFVYVGERWSQQENIIFNYVQPWYTHDLCFYADWGIPLPESSVSTKPAQDQLRLKATLEINNLLGQDYEVIRNFPMPKQNVRFTLSLQY
ncbi:MAG: TonB-dependent receptor [Paludibacteraceae bacterium]|nr:TonB-dependent receptor [Paludibacteraceae bacterium]